MEHHKKGSKAFPVWSQPTSRDKKKEQDGETESAPQPAMMENDNGEETRRRRGNDGQNNKDTHGGKNYGGIPQWQR